MKIFYKPNYKKSVLNVASTLCQYLNAPNDKPVLNKLKKRLDQNYKNVVFILFDGLGLYPMKINLDKNAFLRKNVVMRLTSTFPSTTTNATTSVNTNKYPLEHGWFGWTMRFDQLEKTVTLFTREDALSGEALLDVQYPIPDSDDYWFNYAQTDYCITSVMPSYCKGYEKNRVIANDIDQTLSAIKDIINKQGKQFVFAYCPEPDHSMHDYGVTSKKAQKTIQTINDGLIALKEQSKDTLFIITADHGQTDVSGEVAFYNDKELNDMLLCPAYMEVKAAAFKVKPQYKKQFAKIFTARYGKDFKLYKSRYLIKKGYFGRSGQFAHLLGDYIAVGKTGKLLVATKQTLHFKGHHTSLTEEMLVPLIIFNT